MGDGPDASDQARERADRLVGYLQKCFGYALTGDVSEKAVFCFFDAAATRSGNNGKTTLLEIIRFVLAEYSGQILIDSLMMHQSRESSASLADLGDLRGTRFVTTSEAEEGQRLAVSKLKYITQGMGEIKTCRKYENPITFTATHKPFLDANHKPVVRGTEKAVWNRLKPIPFTVTIGPEEMDKTLLEKLKGEAQGILAWMVEGCPSTLCIRTCCSTSTGSTGRESLLAICSTSRTSIAENSASALIRFSLTDSSAISRHCGWQRIRTSSARIRSSVTSSPLTK